MGKEHQILQGEFLCAGRKQVKSLTLAQFYVSLPHFSSVSSATELDLS
jgi:hypothetical protein